MKDNHVNMSKWNTYNLIISIVMSYLFHTYTWISYKVSMIAFNNVSSHLAPQVQPAQEPPKKLEVTEVDRITLKPIGPGIQQLEPEGSVHSTSTLGRDSTLGRATTPSFPTSPQSSAGELGCWSLFFFSEIVIYFWCQNCESCFISVSQWFLFVALFVIGSILTTNL